MTRGIGVVVVAAAVAVIACAGCGSRRAPATAAASPRPETVAERVLTLLPQGAQIVIEIDLARLRANPVVGAVIARALDDRDRLRALPAGVAGVSLGVADHVVLAAYGVGTAQAATITLLAASAPVTDARRIADGIYGLGPDDWLDQIEQRAALAAAGASSPLVAPAELIALRDRAMPAGAPGASLRVTARLSFDARVSLARQTGLEIAPAQLSVWGDVVDDLAIVVEADAADPGSRTTKQAVARLTAAVRRMLVVLADEPVVRALGVPGSLVNAKLSARGAWVRAVIAIGPAHLRRVVARAGALLVPADAAPAP